MPCEGCDNGVARTMGGGGKLYHVDGSECRIADESASEIAAKAASGKGRGWSPAEIKLSVAYLELQQTIAALTAPVEEKCGNCIGTGSRCVEYNGGAVVKDCPECHGKGRIPSPAVQALRKAFEDAPHGSSPTGGSCTLEYEPHCARCNQPRDRHWWGDKYIEDGRCRDARGRPELTMWTPRPALSCNCWKSTFGPLLESVIATANSAQKRERMLREAATDFVKHQPEGCAIICECVNCMKRLSDLRAALAASEPVDPCGKAELTATPQSQ